MHIKLYQKGVVQNRTAPFWEDYFVMKNYLFNNPFYFIGTFNEFV